MDPMDQIEDTKYKIIVIIKGICVMVIISKYCKR